MEAVKRQTFDLAVLDSGLGSMTGVELAAKLRTLLQQQQQPQQPQQGQQQMARRAALLPMVLLVQATGASER